MRAVCPYLLDADNPEFRNIWIWIIFPIAGAIVAGFMCEWFLLEDMQGYCGDGTGPIFYGGKGKGNGKGGKNVEVTVELDLGNNDLGTDINVDGGNGGIE